MDNKVDVCCMCRFSYMANVVIRGMRTKQMWCMIKKEKVFVNSQSCNKAQPRPEHR